MYFYFPEYQIFDKPMKSARIKNILILLILAAMLATSCAKKSQCPIYWEGTEGGGGAGRSTAGGADKTDWKVETNATKPAGGGEGGENAGSGDPETTAEFPMVRVKRDKNGIISKRPMPRNKVKRKDPRQTYKGNKE